MGAVSGRVPLLAHLSLSLSLQSKEKKNLSIMLFQNTVFPRPSFPPMTVREIHSYYEKQRTKMQVQMQISIILLAPRLTIITRNSAMESNSAYSSSVGVPDPAFPAPRA